MTEEDMRRTLEMELQNRRGTDWRSFAAASLVGLLLSLAILVALLSFPKMQASFPTTNISSYFVASGGVFFVWELVLLVLRTHGIWTFNRMTMDQKRQDILDHQKKIASGLCISCETIHSIETTRCPKCDSLLANTFEYRWIEETRKANS